MCPLYDKQGAFRSEEARPGEVKQFGTAGKC